MNENEIILRAMEKSSPKNRIKKIQKKIFTDEINTSNDPIFKYVKNKGKNKKYKKYVSDWTSLDFIKHLDQNLSLYGISLETSGKDIDSSVMRDAAWMKKLYDKLVDKLQYEMSNQVLLEYIDWWCGTYAAVKTGQHIFIYTISTDEDINRFVSLKQHKEILKKEKTVAVSNDEKVIPMDVYKNFGLNRLLIEKGIVESYGVLVEAGQTAIFSQISSALGTFSKDIFDKVMQTTMSKMYNTKDMVDFMSVARRSIQFHGLEKKYNKVNYKDFFKV